MNGFLVSIVLSTTTLNGAPIVWSNHYGKALTSARSHQRPLLLVLQDPSQPGHRLQHIFQDSDAAQDELLSNFELCRVDITTDYGKSVAKAFRAKKFPYTVVTDNRARKIVFRRAGNMKSQDWQRTLVSYQDYEVGTLRERRVHRSRPVQLYMSEQFHSGPVISGLCPT